MDKKPVVSVIVTAYNQEDYIAEAIESVLKQKFSDWECIIIDDGSSDRTGDICIKIAEMDARIRYVHQINRGVSNARNHGFGISNGMYIQFLDGDDYLMPEKLLHQVNLMDANPQYGVTYSNHLHFWNNTKSYAQYKFQILEEYPIRQLLFNYDDGVSIPIHTALLRRDIWMLNEEPFPNDYKHRYEDWVFWVLIALKNVRFFYINQNYAVYRMHSESFQASNEQIAFNSINAMNYISAVIPIELKDVFQKNRINLILRRYTENKIKSLKYSYHLRKVLSPFSIYFLKVKRSFGI